MPRRPAPGVYWNGHGWVLDLTDRRLDPPRLSVGLGINDKRATKRATSRAAAIRRLIDRAEYDTVDRLRDRKDPLSASDVEAAVRDGDYDSLRRFRLPDVRLFGVAKELLKLTRNNRAESTHGSYRAVIRDLLRHFGSMTPAHALQDRRRWEGWLSEGKPTNDGKPWSAARQATAAMVAGRLMDRAIEREREVARLTGTDPRITHNPVKKAERKPVEKTKIVFLAGDELRALMEATEDRPQAAFVALGFLAGLRRTEAGMLRPSHDVDFENGVIRVQSRPMPDPWKPKTKRGEREIPMGATLRRVLLRHVELGFSGDRYFIIGERGDHALHHSTLTNWAEDAFTAAGLPYGRKTGYTHHVLRHTFASHLLLGTNRPKPVPIHVVAHLMGDRPEEVLRTYAHLLPENQEEAVAVMDAVVERKGEK